MLKLKILFKIYFADSINFKKFIRIFDIHLHQMRQWIEAKVMDLAVHLIREKQN